MKAREFLQKWQSFADSVGEHRWGYLKDEGCTHFEQIPLDAEILLPGSPGVSEKIPATSYGGSLEIDSRHGLFAETHGLKVDVVVVLREDTE